MPLPVPERGERFGFPWVSECAPWDNDSDAFRAALEQRNCLPVMPSNASRAGKIPHDKELYKARSELECTFSLLEQARRFATRYEKTLRNDAGRTHPRGLPTPSRTPLAVR